MKQVYQNVAEGWLVSLLWNQKMIILKAQDAGLITVTMFINTMEKQISAE